MPDLHRLIFFNGIQASPTAASGVATASGSLSFMLVPEPATALAGLAVQRRRRAG